MDDPAAVKTSGNGSAAKLLTAQRQTGRGSRRGADRAQQILTTAERLFRDRGFAETSMDDIAHAVGLLKGSVYYYIDTKDDLLFAIASGVHDVVDEKTQEALGRSDLTPLQRVLHFVRTQVEYNADNVSSITVYHHEWRRLQGEQLADIKRRRHDHALALHGALEKAQDAGELAPGLDLDLVLNHIFAVIIWPYTWFHEGGPVTPQALGASCSQFVYRAIAAGRD